MESTLAELHRDAVKQLALDVEAFLIEHQVGATAFGCLAAGNGMFVTTLRRGRMPTPRTIDRVRAYLDREENAIVMARAGTAVRYQTPAPKK